jgi:GAF domain
MATDGVGRFARVKLWIAERAVELGAGVSVELVCATAVARLGLSGAAVTIDTGRGRLEARLATDTRSGRLAELEGTVGEGPCLEARRGSGPVLVADLAALAGQRRWPLFAPLAVEAGAGALFALPMCVGAIRVGVLALHRVSAGHLGPAALSDAVVFAELVMGLLLDEQAGLPATNVDLADPDGSLLLTPQVHQATGMIAVQIDAEMADAFLRLRAHAFAEQRPLGEVAADVVARKLRFPA